MKTILVVDDDKLNLAAARQVLSDEYKVIPVMKGQQALTYLENGECDIILLDINMPDMDGFEVLGRIRAMENCQSTPVIFLTADNDAETETRCFKEGALDFIAKPFVPAVMLSRISRILELEDLRRSLADRLEQKTREVTEIKNKSRQDALTGLWDRAYTEEMVNKMLEFEVEGSVLMIDIDNFKSVNDTYGHIAGDKTLQMFADTLRKFQSEGDVLCRIGGDEFIVFVKGVTDKGALSDLASDIITDFRKKVVEYGFETDTSVSVGIAQSPDDGTNFTTLYNCGDKALYYVKQNGKNGYHFFSEKFAPRFSIGKKTVDVRYLQDLMGRRDSGTGVYHLDFDYFHYVYNFIRRFVDRNNNEVQILLFTVSESEGFHMDPAETEVAMELLEDAIYSSLRRSDVTTRYSSRQQVVILMDANGENGDMVAGRIIQNFHRLSSGRKARVDYSIVRMDGWKKQST